MNSPNSATPATTGTPPPQSQPSQHDYHEHLIDNVLPAREVHLFAGPSGAGKTTLLMKLLESIEKGETIFSHSSHPTNFIYISGDRSAAGMNRTMDRIGVDKSAFPLYIPGDDVPIASVIEGAVKKYPNRRLLVIEGLATWVPDGKLIDYKVVATFLRKLQRECERRNVTIWGVVHTAKVKKDDRYTNPRERIMGSAAWGAYAETIFYIEPEDPSEVSKNPVRRLMILPRNAKEEVFRLDFKDGLLVPIKSPGSSYDLAIPDRKSNYQVFMEYFNRLNIGDEFTSAQIREATGLRDSSARFEVKKAVDSKLMSQVRGKPLGTYVKNSPAPSQPDTDPPAYVPADPSTVN